MLVLVLLSCEGFYHKQKPKSPNIVRQEIIITQTISCYKIQDSAVYNFFIPFLLNPWYYTIIYLTRASPLCYLFAKCLLLDFFVSYLIYVHILSEYRVMYLLVRVEQQLEHMRKVVQTMQENGAKRSRVRSVSKVMRQLESQHKQLLRILANDATTLSQIGDADDLELFFQNIDSICSATQEISLDGDGGPLCNPDVIIMKDGKVHINHSQTPI